MAQSRWGNSAGREMGCERAVGGRWDVRGLFGGGDLAGEGDGTAGDMRKGVLAGGGSGRGMVGGVGAVLDVSWGERVKRSIWGWI